MKLGYFSAKNALAEILTKTPASTKLKVLFNYLDSDINASNRGGGGGRKGAGSTVH